MNKLKTRGKGKKPAMALVSIRVPQHTLDFFKDHYPKYTDGMRKVLESYELRVSPHRYELQQQAKE